MPSPPPAARTLPPERYTSADVFAHESERCCAASGSASRARTSSRRRATTSPSSCSASRSSRCAETTARCACSRACAGTATCRSSTPGAGDPRAAVPVPSLDLRARRPARRGSGHAADARIRAQPLSLPSLAVEVWHGFVFTNLDPAAPLAPRLERLADGSRRGRSPACARSSRSASSTTGTGRSWSRTSSSRTTTRVRTRDAADDRARERHLGRGRAGRSSCCTTRRRTVRRCRRCSRRGRSSATRSAASSSSRRSFRP